MSWFFTSGGQSVGASTSAAVLPMNIQGWFHLELTGLISLLSKGLSRVLSNTTIRKHQFFSAQPSLWSNSHIHMGELTEKQTWDFRIIWEAHESIVLINLSLYIYIYIHAHTHTHTYIYILCAVLCLVTQLYPTLCNPMDCNSPGFSVHGYSPGKNTGVGCHALLQGLNPGLSHYRRILYRLSHLWIII